MAFGVFNAAVADDDLPIEDPDYWRHRAEEARTRVEQMLDSQTKALMLGIADTYEKIAEAYEKHIVRLEQPRGTKEA